MIEPLLDAAWLTSLTDAVLVARFGKPTFERGRGYATTRVRRLETGDQGRLITASVVGGDVSPYQTLVLAGPAGAAGPGGADSAPRAGVTGRCSCPMRADCKHVVAVILHARSLVDPGDRGGSATPVVPGGRRPVAAGGPAADGPGPDGGGRPVVAPAWELLLRRALDSGEDHPGGVGRDAEPLAIGVSWAPPKQGWRWEAGAASTRPRLRIRPHALTQTGRWAKSGAGWDTVTTGLSRRDFRPEHVDILRRLRALHLGSRYLGYSSTPDYLDVADLGPETWPLLAQAQSAGLDFVAADRSIREFRLADTAQFSLEVTRADTADLVLTPRVLIDERSLDAHLVDWVGDPPHGVVLVDGADLVAAGLDEPLRPAEAGLATADGPLTIPAADVPRFTAAYYPRLRISARLEQDESVDLPTPRPPVLTLEARFEPDNLVTLTWGFRYVIGDDAIDVPVVPAHSAPRHASPHAPWSGRAGEVTRDAEAERRLVEALPAEGRLPGVPAVTTLIGPRRALVPVTRFAGEDTIAIATHLLPALTALPDVHVTIVGDLPDYREVETPTIRLSVSPALDEMHGRRTDWFDLNITIEVDGERVPFQPLFTALVKGRPRMILDSGRHFSLASPALQQLRELIDESRHLADHEGSTLSVSPIHAGLWEELVSIGIVDSESREWVRSVGALLSPAERPHIDPPDGLLAALRPYQLEGYRWLSHLWDAGLGGVLADDMGLGKTVQTLALAARAAQAGELDDAPMLVVAPTSVVGAWAEQAQRFTPGLKVAAVTETLRRRRTALSEVVAGAHVVVTTYAIARIDAEEFAAARWSAAVLDEAQAVKNHRSKTYQAVRKIPAPRRYGITGTPLENSLMDLWSLLSLAAPGLFPDPEMFRDVYQRPIESGTDPGKLERLHAHMRPLVLRRTKEAVAPDLPPKQTQILQVPLSPAHRRVYDRVLHRERQKVLELLDDGGFTKNRLMIFKSLTTLRMLALAPGLAPDVSAPFDTGAPPPSSKLDVLMELLEEVVSGGHRALVFSQFTKYLAMVRDRLRSEGIDHVYLDGRTRDRAKRVEEFRAGDAPVFCISLKAGGTGLTLTEADYVFILDPWWNPAAEDQAIDRAHRIGQDKHVMVYRLVADATIEDKVVALQQRKRDLFDQVVGDSVDAPAPLSADDVRSLLAP